MNWLTPKRIGALLFFALSLFYGWQIQDIPQLPVDALEAMNARSMPWALATLGVVLSIALFVSGGNDTGSNAGKAGVSRYQPANVLTAIVLLIWTALYAPLLDALGFFAATSAFLCGGFLLLGERRLGVLATVTLSAAGLLYALLRFGLGLYLPEGTLWLALGISNV